MTEPERITLPRVLAVLESFHTSAEIYILRPLRALAQQGKIQFEARMEKEVSLSRLAWADLVVYGRNVTAESHPLFEEVISRGLPCVYVLDDNFWDLPAELELDQVYRKAEQLRQLERYVRFANRVKVFSPFLAEKVRHLNPAVLLSTPCIDFSLLPAEAAPRDPSLVKITYVTARGTKDPFLPLFAAELRAVLQKYPQQIELNLFGRLPAPFADLPNVRCLPLNWDYPSFIHQLGGSGFDIGLAPMSETPFNLSKTNTKLRDYGACRIAGIYSDVPNYADVQNGVTGLVVKQEPGAWFEALERLVLDEELRSRIQENAYHYVYAHYRQEITEAEWAEEINELSAPRRSLLVEKNRIPVARRLRFGLGSSPTPAWQAAPSWKPGVDVVLDLQQPLPFAEDALDAIFLDHQLEEVADLEQVMGEIYRISRDGASVSVTSAFARNDASEANPRMQQKITGQTARYWTAAKNPMVYPPEAGLPEDLPNWGLRTDHRMDFRPLRIECFHSAEVMHLPAGKRWEQRNQCWNVCDTIFIRLLVVKPAGAENGMSERMVTMETFEPLEITLRRLRELTETQVVELEAGQAARQSAEAGLQAAQETTARLQGVVEAEQHALQAERANHFTEMAKLQASLQWLEEKATALQAENQSLAEQLLRAEEAQNELNIQHLAALKSQISSAREELQAVEISRAQQAAGYEQTVAEYRRIGQNVALQLDEQRRRFVYRLISRLRDRSNLLPNLPPGLQQLVDDSYLFNRNLRGYLLQPGSSLHAVPFIPYHISPGRAGWRGVILAGVLDMPLTEGYIGVEIVSPQQKIVAQSSLTALQIASYLPLKLEFPPLAESADGEFELRVFGRGLDAPFRLLEWRKYRLGGLLSIHRKPFEGLIF